MNRPPGHPWAGSVPQWPPKSAVDGFGDNSRRRGGFHNHPDTSALEDEYAFTPDFEKDDPFLLAPQPERKRFAKMEQRTIFVKNLSDRATHKDIVDFVRGGLVLDIYLRSNERCASISFVEGSAAQEFMSYVRRNDVYVHGRRVWPHSTPQKRGDLLIDGVQLEFLWSERQYILPGHVANKIGIGVLIQISTPFLIRKRLDHDLRLKGSTGQTSCLLSYDADLGSSFRSDSKCHSAWKTPFNHRRTYPGRPGPYSQARDHQYFFQAWRRLHLA